MSSLPKVNAEGWVNPCKLFNL